MDTWRKQLEDYLRKNGIMPWFVQILLDEQSIQPITEFGSFSEAYKAFEKMGAMSLKKFLLAEQLITLAGTPQEGRKLTNSLRGCSAKLKHQALGRWNRLALPAVLGANSAEEIINLYRHLPARSQARELALERITDLAKTTNHCHFVIRERTGTYSSKEAVKKLLTLGQDSLHAHRRVYNLALIGGSLWLNTWESWNNLARERAKATQTLEELSAVQLITPTGHTGAEAVVLRAVQFFKP